MSKMTLVVLALSLTLSGTSAFAVKSEGQDYQKQKAMPSTLINGIDSSTQEQRFRAFLDYATPMGNLAIAGMDKSSANEAHHAFLCFDKCPGYRY